MPRKPPRRARKRRRSLVPDSLHFLKWLTGRAARLRWVCEEA